jgi:SulP family sulfate permease
MASIAERLFGDWVRRVSRDTLRADALAGLLGAVLVLPQGIAFATLAGLPPEYGLYTAVVPCIIAALFGSSWHVMSGPTNANSLALFAMLSPLAFAFSPAYIQLALAVTVMVGIMQWLIGTLRLGSLANFISPAALFGFTSGAALLIAVYALPDLLGLAPAAEHGAAGVLKHVFSQLSHAQPAALLVAAITAVVAFGVRRLRPNWPFMLMGLAAATAATMIWLHFTSDPVSPAQALRTVGALKTPWPRFELPHISWAAVPDLLGLAFALTIVALGQAISIAKAVAARSGQRIDANREFRGQGLSNIVGGFFSCYVSCGSMNRSMPNLEAGARTPLASVFSALLLLVLVAVSLSLMSFLYRTSKPAMRTMGFDGWGPERQFVVIDDVPHPPAGTSPQPDLKVLPECPQLKLLRMEGEVYFGATQHVADTLHALRNASHVQKHLLVMGKSMNFIDLAGAELWEAELNARRAIGGDLYFHRPRPEVIAMWQTTGFTRLLGPEHQFPDKRTAIATIFPKLDPEICKACTARIFWECKSVPQPDAIDHA